MIIKNKNKKNRITKKNKKSKKSNKSNKSNKSKKIRKSQSGGFIGGKNPGESIALESIISVKDGNDMKPKLIEYASPQQTTENTSTPQTTENTSTQQTTPEASTQQTTPEASTPQQPTENTSTPQTTADASTSGSIADTSASLIDDDGIPIKSDDNPDPSQSASASPSGYCQSQDDEIKLLRYNNHYLGQENYRVHNELSKFIRDAPPELQVKSAGEVPFIDAQYIFDQINDIGVVDKNKLDTRLIHVATLTRKEPFLRANTENSFYKFNVSPPPREKMFTAYLQNTPVEIPFPASLFLRYRKEGNTLSLRGVYVVDQDTLMEARMNPYEVDLTGLIKLETEQQYNERKKKLKPTKMISGDVSPFDMKILGHQMNMTFPNPEKKEIENLEKAIKGELSSATGAKSNYLLTRFNITDIRVQNAYNLVKGLTSRGDSKPSDPGKIVATAATSAAKVGAKSLFNLFTRGGKRRKNIKYKTKKIKYKKNKNRKTRVRIN
jgi:hypothetical protein